MRMICFLYGMLFGLMCAVGSEPIDLDLSNMKSSGYVIQQVAKEHRGLFITYHLAIGLNKQQIRPRVSVDLPMQANIPDELYKKFQKIPTPPRFSERLLNWSKTTFNMTDKDVLTLVTYAEICVPSKGCFDPNDIGSLCCPF